MVLVSLVGAGLTLHPIYSQVAGRLVGWSVVETRKGEGKEGVTEQRRLELIYGVISRLLEGQEKTNRIAG